MPNEENETYDSSDSAACFEQGVSALEQGEIPAAVRAFEAYIALRPDDGDGWYNLGVAHYELGELAAAAASMRQAARHGAEGLAQSCLEIAAELQSRQRPLDALPFCELASEITPSVQARQRLIWLLRDCNQTDRALAELEQALSEQPRHLGFKLQKAFLQPQIYQSPEHMAHWRQHLLRELDDLEAWLTEPALLTGSRELYLYSPIFDLMAMGENEAATYARISAIWRRIFAAADADRPLAPRPSSGPLRLGIVSATVYGHSTMTYFMGMLELLRQQGDITTAIFYAGPRRDDTTAYVESLTPSFFQLAPDLEALRTTISAWEPDVLLYLDVGIEPMLYTLAHYRLAPLQCVTSGVPITTGISTMDAYLSCAWFEPPEADAYYSEALFRTHKLNVLMHSFRLPETRRTRQDFGFADDEVLYVFPHTLIRVDPELDALIAQILIGVPKSRLLLIGFQQLETQVLERLTAKHAGLADRIGILPRMPQPEFLNLLSLCDLALDGLRLGGGNLSFQCFAVGLPVICCPSPFLRCRIAAGLYRLSGILDTIAADWPDYARRAIALGQDAEARRLLSQNILAAREQVFEQSEGVSEIFDFFRSARTRP